MDCNFNLIRDLYARVIRHNLSQPEGIDQALLAMAADDLTLESPAASGARLIETVRSIAQGRFATAAGFSYGVAHRKTSRRLPDYYVFSVPRYRSK